MGLMNISVSIITNLNKKYNVIKLQFTCREFYNILWLSNADNLIRKANKLSREKVFILDLTSTVLC